MALDFRDVFARHWSAYSAHFGARIPLEHRKAAEAILNCHTAALGGSLYRCEDCGHFHYAYHPCNHRNCPQCGHEEARQWARKQHAKLLPVPYSMVTLTVPGELRKAFRSHQKLCFNLFFQCAAAVLQAVAANPKYLGGALGLLGVLHTWGRRLQYHPHIHFIVPHGGLSPDGAWVRPKGGELFLPYDLLSIKLRIAMQKALRESDPLLYKTIPEKVWWKKWKCHATEPGKGEHAIDYLSRYVAQTALSSKRILVDDGKHVVIQYTDSNSGEKRTLPLTGREFVRRFLQHVLPTGFKRVRYYGWLSPAAHKRFARIQALLDWKPTELPDEDAVPLCPQCHRALVRVENWPRGRSPPMIIEVARPLYERRAS